MKRIEAIIRPDALRAVRASLKAVGYPGVTVQEAEGHGTQKGKTETYRSQSVDGLLPKLVVSMVVEDNVVEKAIDTIIQSARRGDIGDGKIFIYSVVDVIRIRTGDRGKAAL
ncbi:MAG TPA: P-II family nitrogen regulator [bacterium]|nr:P-II family nitrogen regulator [bacterium]